MDIQSSLENALKQLNLLSITSYEQKQALIDYVELIRKWNKTYNITAIKTTEEILKQHVFDSLAIIPFLINHKKEDEAYRLIDVGSGGGLPGVIIAIMLPQWQITCVDAVEKKTSFITLVAGRLKLKNLRSLHSRIQDVEKHSADLIVSRAFASLIDFVNWSSHCLIKNGELLAMKALYKEEEISALENQTEWKVKKHIELDVPQLEAERCLFLIHKKEESN